MSFKDQDQPNGNNRILHYHAVLLYDVLGQSSKLNRIATLPSNPEELASVSSLVRETAGAVINLRNDLRKYYKGIAKSQISLESLGLKDRKLFQDSRRLLLAYRNFSDMTVAHVPLIEKSVKDHPMMSVLALVGSAAGMMLVSLARKAPIRGAIEIGLAVNLEGEEIYGPILDCVYKMESKEANWPRIIAGPNLVDYLTAGASSPPASKTDQIRSGLAQMALRLISGDVDGKYIVDYLGAGMKKFQGAKLPAELVEKAIAFATSSRNEFAEIGDKKHADRYDQVLSYCLQRKAIWE